MPKNSISLAQLPPEASSALARLGEDLAVARIRRKESQKSWAHRIGCSVPTLRRVEQGDPTVSIGIYVTALWMMGRVAALAELAAPASDRVALEGLLRDVRKTQAARSSAALRTRLSKLRVQP